MKIEIDKPVVPQWFDDWYKTFGGNKTSALYFLNRAGRGHALTYYNEREVDSYSDRLQDLFGDDRYENAQEYFSKAILFGYEIDQEPRYYAKIKGWEHVGASIYYFGYDEDKGSLEVTYLKSDYRFAFSLTKEQWNEIGINDTNADFEEVE